MKLLPKLALLNLLCFPALPVMAENVNGNYFLGNQPNPQANTPMQQLLTYFQNFGGYLGYDVTVPANAQNNTNGNPLSQTLLNLAYAQPTQTNLFYTVLGATPVNAFTNTLAQFVPESNNTINNYSNAVFNLQKYSTPNQQGAGVSVSSSIDQKPYQPDPVNQAILNILGIPDPSFCSQPNASTMAYCQTSTASQGPLTTSQVPLNVIGESLPSPQVLFDPGYIQLFMSQLNSNTLTGPLLYSTEASQSTKANTNGLTAGNQAQEAANFIRYAAASITPIKLPNYQDYDMVYTNTLKTQDPTAQQKAQANLSNYLTRLRTFAAQNSVGLSNLYYIMSKRLPQNETSSGGPTTQTSQALNEFNMATWRLFNPSSNPQNNPSGASTTGAGTSSTTQWMNQINNASTATVEKEIAILLAEINYQMYLDRQIQERLLLTNSILLLQNTRLAQPTPQLTVAQ